jgi:predicted nucleic acid-binding protein
MIVISNTGPINYLVLIEEIGILPVLFGTVSIPQAVERELGSAQAPDKIRKWLGSSPGWLRVLEVEPDTSLAGLDAGEAEAISLAVRARAGLIMLDEAKARRAARERGLTVVGTLGILDKASGRGLVDLTAAVSRLRSTTFRASPKLLAYFEARGTQRRGK